MHRLMIALDDWNIWSIKQEVNFNLTICLSEYLGDNRAMSGTNLLLPETQNSMLSYVLFMTAKC